MSNSNRHFHSLGDVSAEAAAQGAVSDRDPMAEFDLSSLLPREPPSSHDLLRPFEIQIEGRRRQ